MTAKGVLVAEIACLIDVLRYVDEFLKRNKVSENKKEVLILQEQLVKIFRDYGEYDFKDFKNTLQDMGIQKVFTSDADLSLILQNHKDAYVNDAIHKTYVKVNEKGTKAAAVTYFGIKDNAMPAEEKEYVSVIFDKPFAFIIKDHNSHEILFFGVVYEPEKWDATKTCD